MAVRLLPTPSASDDTGAEGATRTARQDERTGGPSLRDLVHLLPTPAARDGKGPNPNEREGGHDLPMAMRVLLPTPTASYRGDRSAASKASGGGRELRAVSKLLPTPVANPENPGAGGELRAALTHGPTRRNETGIDTFGRPNWGRSSGASTPEPSSAGFAPAESARPDQLTIEDA